MIINGNNNRIHAHPCLQFLHNNHKTTPNNTAQITFQIKPLSLEISCKSDINIDIKLIATIITYIIKGQHQPLQLIIFIF